ncbi:MAG: bifunctional oligoribonuclease/PAP phosphatase NrnA [Balneolaceae bacterium]
MFSEFIGEISKFKRVGVLSHIRPDGDCIGAQIALCRWLQLNGIESLAFNDDPVPDNLNWLLKKISIQKPTDETLSSCDLFIMVDGNATHRFGMFSEWIKNRDDQLWMIDHHPDPDDTFDLAISVPTASSTCELIYQLFDQHRIDQIDQDIAKILYTGIITDTGSLQYDSVTPKTVEITADLLRRGEFKPNEVIETLFSNKSLPQLKLLSKALESIQLFENNQIAIICVNQEMLSETGTTFEDCDGFVDYPLSLSNVKAAIFFKDHGKDGIRMSLRSRSDLDVNIWARQFGGGGHQKAAGAWHKGPIEETINEVINKGVKQLRDIEK